MKRNRTRKKSTKSVPAESFQTRCARLRNESESVNDDSSAMFFTALYQAVSLRIPEPIKEACLILLLNRKLAD